MNAEWWIFIAHTHGDWFFEDFTCALPGGRLLIPEWPLLIQPEALGSKLIASINHIIHFLSDQAGPPITARWAPWSYKSIIFLHMTNSGTQTRDLSILNPMPYLLDKCASFFSPIHSTMCHGSNMLTPR